ncbi:MAG: succinylglutamate desuccinylase/aspartoacylase family protein [Paracoccus sp. (in: a-proteobacteria)]|uniref:succinylglutamate desuccinylase/aspartoacylase domain-containing protein n=1 Tax=Paracoccus sp. TaxID=267 RepID=UPI0026DF4435|nr:succinylglutamate desuccinylase/aspartoacylase family protein [Paracoccus sp. (in: a-proteobacteria)]MDO5620352.1 succinylglutamate desuccinylase/aspartoacylase family protein [Paracoccus sp. (in: a-proteobacteria)]
MSISGKGSGTGLPNPYPVQITTPDISAYAKGNTGTPYLWTFDSGQPGPHVAISALVHGNEPCGALALDRLLRADTRPLRGRLSLVFVNTEAAAAFDPSEPDASRWLDEDMNRLWSPAVLDDASRPLTAELSRARELRPWLETVDLLLDLHSMQHKTPPLALAGWQDRGVALAQGIGCPPVIVCDHGHAEGVRMRDYGGFASDQGSKAAVLIECGQHWEAASETVAHDCVDGFLRHTRLIEGQPPAARAEILHVTEAVTIASADFRFAQDWVGFERLPQGTLIATDGGQDIRAPHDPTVLIMPSRRLWPGKTAVRLARIGG